MVRKDTIHRYYAFDIYKLERICDVCKIGELKKYRKDGKSYTNLHVHHKDRNYQNNKRDNLQVLCASCHAREHGKLIMRLEKFGISNELKLKGYSLEEHLSELLKLRRLRNKKYKSSRVNNV